MANAPVGPVVVSLVIKLLQIAETAILGVGGPSPKVTTLINKQNITDYPQQTPRMAKEEQTQAQ